MAEVVVQPQDEFGRYSLFFPIKVVNGFVTCDFILGCYCCKFCLNRRYPDWQRLLEMDRVYRNPLQIEQAARLLGRVKALTRAKVTLKFGHDTDMSLEESEAQQLVNLMPADQPVVFMRRGKLLPHFRPFHVRPHPNLLMELTLTPRSAFLEYDNDPFPILESFQGLATEMFYTIGPVCEDNLAEARELIRCLPAGSRMWVRDLIVKDIPTLPAGGKDGALGETLREFARDQGHRVISYLNCVARAGVGLGFHKRGEFVSEPNTWQLHWCQTCAARAVCFAEQPAAEEERRIYAALAELGLSLARPLQKFAHKSYAVVVQQEVNFGDEAYLREITSLKIDLWKEGHKTGTAVTAAIADRWQATDFFPVEEMLALAKESYQLAFAGG